MGLGLGLELELGRWAVGCVPHAPGDGNRFAINEADAGNRTIYETWVW